MSQLALDLGVPSTLVTEAVYARCLSAMKDGRVRASKVLKGPSAKYTGDKKKFIEQIRQALYASKICSYAQGFVQMQAAAEEHNWPLNYGDCRHALARRLHHPRRVPRPHQGSVRRRSRSSKTCCSRPTSPRPSTKPRTPGGTSSSTAAELGIPVPAFATALAYYDGYRRDRLPANLLQAQRDYFGAHTYERTDKPGTFHTDWIRERRTAVA